MVHKAGIYTLVLMPLLLFLSIPLNIRAQKVPAMIHDLRGLNDSAGTTHLYYRLFEVKWDKVGEDIEDYSNTVYHYNTQTNIDSVFLADYAEEDQITGSSSSHSTIDYEFINNDPEDYIASKLYCQTECDVALIRSGNEIDYFSGRSVYTSLWWGAPLVNNPEEPSIIYISSLASDTSRQLTDKYGQIIPDTINADSVSLNYSLRSMSPHRSDVRFGFKQDRLIRQTADNPPRVVDSSANILSNVDFYYGNNPHVVYYRTQYQDLEAGYIHSSNIYRSTSDGKSGSWEPIAQEFSHIAFATDTTNGRVYKSSRDTLLVSDDQGGSFRKLTIFSNRITGIYKPNTGSDTLYVSTISDIWLLEGEQKLDSLKHVAVDIAGDNDSTMPVDFTLQQNYPNPFNPSTNIRFSLPKAGQVNINVYNTIGQKIETLINRQMTAGSHSITFNAEGLPSGVYIYRLNAGDYRESRKMLLVK